MSAAGRAWSALAGVVALLAACQGPTTGPKTGATTGPTAGPQAVAGGAAADDAPPGAREQRPPPPEPLAMARVRELLRELDRENKSSTIRLEAGSTPSPGARLAALGPAAIAALDDMLRAGDPDVVALGGSFFAILVNDLDAVPRFAPPLVDRLADARPAWRAFACEALGYLAWPDATPHLQALLDDDAEVQGYTAGTVVADFAAIALRRRGAARQDGR